VTLGVAIKLVAVTRSRHISRDSRSGILVGIGAALVLAPVAAGLSLAALVSGVLFATAGDPVALALFAGAGAVQLITAAVTRYHAPAAAQDFLS